MNTLDHILLSITTLLALTNVSAQTPFDTFSPETSRIILDKETMDAWRKETFVQDTIVFTTTKGERFWLTVDPLASQYPSVSPYMYCNGNPVMFVDPDGRKVIGHSSEDIEIFFQDIGEVLQDSKFDEYKNMLVRQGKRIKQINQDEYEGWKNTVSLSNDEECFVDLLTNVINSKDIYNIEYIPNDRSKMSIKADYYLSNSSPILTTLQGALYWFGGALTGGNIGGGSSYSVIAQSGESIVNLRAVNSTHEVLGHGYGFNNGLSVDDNQVQALRVENLVRRLMHLAPYDGSTHPHPVGANLNLLPLR